MTLYSLQAVIKAFDTVQLFMESDKPENIVRVKRFFVKGESKRGLLAYLSAAVDDRVKGIAPTTYTSLGGNIVSGFVSMVIIAI